MKLDLEKIVNKFKQNESVENSQVKTTMSLEKVTDLFNKNTKLADAVYEATGAVSFWDKEKLYDTSALRAMSAEEVFNHPNFYKRDGTIITVYAATNNVTKLLAEGFSGEHTGLGTTKGEPQGTIFLTPGLCEAADYANIYKQNGVPNNMISVVEVEIKNGAGVREGDEIRILNKADILSVKESDEAKKNRDDFAEKLDQRKQKAKELYLRYLSGLSTDEEGLERYIPNFEDFIKKNNLQIV